MSKEYTEEMNDEDTVYEEDAREELVASGSMSSEEDAFMKGYDESAEDDKEDEVL